MNDLKFLLQKNKKWSDQVNKKDDSFFKKLSMEQNPKYLWIGCSDSRVIANSILDLLPGNFFIHNNIANVVASSDINLLSTLQYAIESLKIKEIIVCGHHGCGGIAAADENKSSDTLAKWLSLINNSFEKNSDLINELQNRDEKNKYNMLSAINVMEQTVNVARMKIVQQMWKNGKNIKIHSLLYHLETGLLKKISIAIENNTKIDAFYEQALKYIKNTYIKTT